ncbi:MAG TPA: RlmE family RNA methyltransferase [Rhizobiales bacterium]|nr:RlmE family RNA methyltransferase [Hyphomicrobiales bacterium]
MAGPRKPSGWNRPASGGPGGRELKKKVKTARGRTVSSTNWLKRQLNDPYVAAARREGYRSRSAFKLSEIDDRFKFLKPGGAIVDLGAAPGGWSQVAARRTKADEGRGRVVAIDLREIEPIAGVTIFQKDFYDEDAPQVLIDALGGVRADAVISDMAAHATGHRQTDHIKIMDLAETALMFAREILKPGGVFLCKVLRGGTENELLATLKKDFRTVRHIKPSASRSDSAELFVLALGFRKQS